MAIKYGNTTIQKIMYNGVDLDKVYYGNTIVFSKPTVYGGGNGTSLFSPTSFNSGTNWHQYDISYANLAQYDLTKMQATLQSTTSGAGTIWFLTNKKFSIGLFNSIKANFDIQTNKSGAKQFISFGVTSSVERVPSGSHLKENGYTNYNRYASGTNQSISYSIPDYMRTDYNIEYYIVFHCELAGGASDWGNGGVCQITLKSIIMQ